jgi:multiple sugar transport system substrate-binding protein
VAEQPAKSDPFPALTRRGFLTASALFGGSFAAAACAPKAKSKTEATPPAAAPSGAASQPPAEVSGEVNALFMKQAAYSEDDVKAMIASFTAAYPKIKVTPTFVAYEALQPKIVAAAPAGTYDVVLIDVIWPAEFGSKGLITDITAKWDPAQRNAMLPGAVATAGYEGKYYGVPWIVDTKYFFSNRDHLQKAGVDPASIDTWDGVLAAAKAIKEKAGVEYPLAWSWAQAEAIICDYTQLLGAFGGEFLDSGGKPAFNKGGGVQALEFMQKSLADKLTNPASTTFLEDDVKKTFTSGKASLALNWTYMYAGAQDPKESSVAGKVDISQTPAGPDGKRPGCNGSMALSITSQSKNQDAAWLFVQHLTSQKVQDQYAKNTLPVWAASYDNPEVVKTSPEVVKVAKSALGDMILRPQVKNYTQVSQLLQVELQNALTGKKDAQKALDDAAKQATDAL